jgi:tetratricopeptide (TPR) repeat protein
MHAPRPRRADSRRRADAGGSGALVPVGAAWLQLALIALAACAAYSNTLHVPFYLDDFSAIRENPLVSRWQGIGPLWSAAPTRLLAALSLALNYRLGRFDPLGYHLFNTLVHLLAGVAVLGLARGVVRSPRVCDSMPEPARVALPLVTALVFALHPLQTQAVTYVVQRLTSLVAVLYLGALAAYVQARLAPATRARIAWAAICVAATLATFVTKENSATLPIALLLTEVALFTPSRRRLLWTSAAALAAIAVLWAIVALGHASDPRAGAHSLDVMTRETPDVPRGRYLATQMVVLLRYLRLFVLPTGLHLDYAFPLRDGLPRGEVLLAASVHVALLGVGLACWRRRPVVTFGVLFYYLAHAVESSVFPIRDVIFEHRTYLPNFGLCLVAAWLLVAELPRTPFGARLGRALVPLILVALGVATWQRNQQWRDPVAFWQRNARLAPAKPRVWATLGRNLVEANRPEEGAEALEHAIRLRRETHDPGDEDALDAINMMWALRLLKRYDQALALNAEFTRRPLPPWVRANFYVNEGNVYFEQQRPVEADQAFRRAVELAPHSLPAMANLASTGARLGRYAEAESLYVEVLVVDPDDRTTRFNLWQVRARARVQDADALARAHRAEAALEAYRSALQAIEEALRLDPDDAAATAYANSIRRTLESVQATPAPPPPGP